MNEHKLPTLDSIKESDAELFLHNSVEITLLMNDFLLRYLNTVYQEFSGDITQAIVLGEIANHTVSSYIREGKLVNCTIKEADENFARKKNLRACNPFSISEATGIPRETVRRKFAELEKMGYIEKVSGRSYILTALVTERFIPDFNLRLFQGLKNLFSEILTVTKTNKTEQMVLNVEKK